MVFPCTTAYTYDGLNLLALAAARSDGATWSVTYLYDGTQRPYGGIYRASDATATLFAMVTTDRGDGAELLDASGTPLAAYRYDAFGRPTTTTVAASQLASAIANRQVLRYAGYAWAAESGLYYCSARSYDPVSAQFISKDPAKADGEESAYQYCGGDPVERVDPSGLHCLWSYEAEVTVVRNVFAYWHSRIARVIVEVFILPSLLAGKATGLLGRALRSQGWSGKAVNRYAFGAALYEATTIVSAVDKAIDVAYEVALHPYLYAGSRHVWMKLYIWATPRGTLYLNVRQKGSKSWIHPKGYNWRIFSQRIGTLRDLYYLST
jgi:RHS repeat-associated protein